MKRRQIILILIVLLANISTRSWRSLPENYKGVLYTSFINSCYYYLFKRHLLWEFNPGTLDWRIIRFLHVFFVTPSLVLICLSFFPKTLSKQIPYLLKWVAASSFIEQYLSKKNMILYKHGWNDFWSGVVYVQMYVFSYLYNKRPILTWILSLFSIVFYIVKFNWTVDQRFLKGPFSFIYNKIKDSFKERNRKINILSI